MKQWEVWVIALLVLIVVFVASLFIPLMMSPQAMDNLIPTPEFTLPDMQPTIVYHQGRGNYAQALYNVNALAIVDGWTPELALQAGNLWRDMGNLENAFLYWQRAGNIENANHWRRMADAAIRLGYWAEAQIALDRLLQLNPQDRWGHYHAGMIAAAFDPLRAEQHLSFVALDAAYDDIAEPVLRLIQNDPSDPLIALRVGILLSDFEEWTFAELALRHAVVVGISEAEALAYTGLARYRQGKDGEAWINRAVTLAPGNAEVRFVQGLGLRTQQELDRSLSVMLLAVTLDPTNPAIQAELGTAYRLIGALDEAEYWLQEAIRTSENAPQFQDLLVRFYSGEARNLPPEVLSLLGDTVALQPNDPGALASYGWVLHVGGDTEGGLAQLDIALGIEPAHPLALYNKAQILLEINAINEARIVLEELVILDSPFQSDVARILENLNG